MAYDYVELMLEKQTDYYVVKELRKVRCFAIASVYVHHGTVVFFKHWNECFCQCLLHVFYVYLYHCWNLFSLHLNNLSMT